MVEKCKFVLDGIDERDNVIVGIRGSGYNGRYFLLKPKVFVEMLRVLRDKTTLIIDTNDAVIKAYKDFLR